MSAPRRSACTTSTAPAAASPSTPAAASRRRHCASARRRAPRSPRRSPSADAALRALSATDSSPAISAWAAAAWAARPGARRVDCTTDCAAAIREAIAAGARLLVIDGDAAIAGPADFGSAEDPVALVASGALRLSGEIAVHGVVHAAAIEWNDVVAGRALVRGAVLVGGDYRGTGAVDLVRDAAVLARLAAASGSFVRVNGSWKDF